MHHTYIYLRGRSKGEERRAHCGFLALDDLVEDQGEIAIQIVLGEDGTPEIEAYSISSGEAFSETEVRDMYIQASIAQIEETDSKVGEIVSAYLSRVEKGGNRNPIHGSAHTKAPRSKFPKVNKENITIVDSHDHTELCTCGQDWQARYEQLSSIKVDIHEKDRNNRKSKEEKEILSVFAGKKYKPVAQKIRPVLAELPDKYRIIRDIKGDPLADMPALSPNPGDFTPTARYTQERMERIDSLHDKDFLWSEERKLMHEFRICVG